MTTLARHICEDCPSRTRAACLRPHQASDLAIVFDFPTTLEARRGKLLEGDTGRLLKSIFKAHGIDHRDLYVTSALNCRPVGTKETILRPAMEACRRRLVNELREVGAKRVLALGPIAYAALTSHERIARTVKVRGRWKHAYGMQVLGTYAPVSVLVDIELFRDLATDIDKFLTTSGKEPYPQISVLVAHTHVEVRRAFDEMSEFDWVSCDFETTGFSPIQDTPLALGYAAVDPDDDPQQGWAWVLSKEALDDRRTWSLVAKQLSAHQPTVFHNAKFDLKFMRRGLERNACSYEPGNVQDTMILNYLRDERPMGKYAAHSLEGIARVRYDAPDYGIDMGKWLKQLPTVSEDDLPAYFRRMYMYCGADCYYTARLYPDLLDDLEDEDEGILRVYDDLLMPAVEALADVELRGMCLDVERLDQLREQLNKREQRLLRKIRLYVGQWQEAEEFNPNSTKQLKEFVYDRLKMPITKTERRGKLQEGPTSSAVFKILAGQYPEHRQFFMDVIEYRTARKTIGTYIDGLLKRMDSDGRIRSDLLLNGTTTGRLSSRNPNLQNIPEVSHVKIDIRECFVPADEDWVLIEGDYSQLELRVAAHLSEDEAWLQVYLEDRDLHQDVAGALYKRPRDQITPYQRWLAKCTVFGAMYGRGAKSIALGPEMDYIENEMGGTRWTLEEAQSYFDNFFAKYHQFKNWIDRQHELVYQQHYITTPFGRRRRFPFIPRNDNGLIRRQAVNNPIQSTASDITLSALVRIHHRLLDLNARVGHVVAHVVLTVHDSVMVECHVDYQRKVERIMRSEMMENLPIVSRVPFKADLHASTTWSGLK